MREIVVWGGGGQLKVIQPILNVENIKVNAIVNKDPNFLSPIATLPIFHSIQSLIESGLLSLAPKPLFFAVAIGGDHGFDRVQIHQMCLEHGLHPITIIHPSAWVAETARLAEGVQVLAMAAVSEDVVIGEQSIINTNASVDHDCIIGKGVHIMPGATLAGCCNICDFVSIGTNATILPRITIGEGAVIGAGAVVTKAVPPYSVSFGNPSRVIKTKELTHHV